MFPIIAISLIEKCKLKIRFFFTSFFSYCNLWYQGLTKCFKKTVSAFELNNFTDVYRLFSGQKCICDKEYFCNVITISSFVSHAS